VTCTLLWCHFLQADCLIVTDPPKIIVHPEAEPEGENVTLSCKADGNPVPAISWTRNGSPVNTTINSRIRFSDDKKQLTIYNECEQDRQRRIPMCGE